MVLIKQLKGYQSYQSVIKDMEKNVEKIKSEGESNEVVWLLEHNSVFTAGSSNSGLNREYIEKIPVINVNRGGQMTFHGPGQLVIYFMLNIKKRKLGLIEFIDQIEKLIINAFARENIKLYTKKEKNRGLWIKSTKGMKKIIFIGLRYSGGVIYHGVSINFKPDLQKFRLINPCGLNVFEISSLEELGIDYSYNRIVKEIKNQMILEFP
jgi:lipoyl(octanoyl) transferase